jgi:predicted nucleic acid-binding protein
MKLDELVSGAIYLDTNVLYMYLRADPAHLPTIRTFVTRVVQGEIEGVIGGPVLDELFYRLLLAKIRDGSSRNPLEALRADTAANIRLHGPLI